MKPRITLFATNHQAVWILRLLAHAERRGIPDLRFLRHSGLHVIREPIVVQGVRPRLVSRARCHPLIRVQVHYLHALHDRFDWVEVCGRQATQTACMFRQTELDGGWPTPRERRTRERRPEELLLPMPCFASSVKVFRSKVPTTLDVQQAFFVELDALNLGHVWQILIRLE
eukprot:COSAG02_NODE_191_length_30004_cov_86.740980_5_plen_171_part_00